MKKDEKEMRAEYKRSDFEKLTLGKFFKQTTKGTSVAPIEPKKSAAMQIARTGKTR